jgi:hypothetical protein
MIFVSRGSRNGFMAETTEARMCECERAREEI